MTIDKNNYDNFVYNDDNDDRQRTVSITKFCKQVSHT